MTVHMRHTRSHTGNRRSHHALTKPRLSMCANCGEQHVRHEVCTNCGQYRGRQVVDVAALHTRKAARAERKRRELGEEKKSEEHNAAAETKDIKPLDAGELSRGV